MRSAWRRWPPRPGIDLDSQGHASKCLGVQGEEAEKTLFDAIIKKTPLAS